MKKSLKIGLGVGLGLTAVVGTAAGLGVSLTSKNNVASSVATGGLDFTTGSTNGSILNGQKTNVNNFTSSNLTSAEKEAVIAPISKEQIAAVTSKDGHTIATFTIAPLTRDTEITNATAFSLTINNLTTEYGQIEFVQNGLGVESITVHPTETVQVRAKAGTVKNGYELYDLDVHCKNNSSYYLDTTKSGDVYSFTLPSAEKNQFGEINPFYNGQTTIEVNAIFAPKQVASWVYDFNHKSYKYQITSNEFILDDKSSQWDMAMTDVNATNSNPVNYVLDMNGHDLKIGTFTIPKGCNLIIIDSQNMDGIESKRHKVMNGNKNDGTVENQFGHIILDGVLSKFDNTFKWGELTPAGATFATWHEYVEVSTPAQIEAAKANK